MISNGLEVLEMHLAEFGFRNLKLNFVSGCSAASRMADRRGNRPFLTDFAKGVSFWKVDRQANRTMAVNRMGHWRLTAR